MPQGPNEALRKAAKVFAADGWFLKAVTLMRHVMKLGGADADTLWHGREIPARHRR